MDVARPVSRDVSIRGISFDVGQTLLRPFPSFGEVFARCCALEGVALGYDAPRELERFAERTFAELREKKLTYSDSAERSRAIWIDLYARFLAQSNVESLAVSQLSERIYATFLDHRTYELYEDALPVLRRLKDRGFKIGITSNWESWLSDLLVAKGLSDLVDFASISGIVGFEKPDRRIFEDALRVARLPAGAVVHVGDSLIADVRGAQQAGMRAILLDRDGLHPKDSVDAVTSLHDLLARPEFAAPA
jgi:putative hydrolase of the HAD superfamily